MLTRPAWPAGSASRHTGPVTAPTDAPSGGDHGPVAAPPPSDPQERRRLVLAAALFFGGLVVVIAAVALLSGDAGDARPSATTQACATDDAECLAAQQSVERPGIIPRPGEGQAPDEPGDRGGWEQIALFGVLVGALALIVVLVVRAARRHQTRPRTNAPHRT